MIQPRLGRLLEHDERSRGFPAPAAVQVRTRSWSNTGPVLDQGATSSCTGNAMAQARNTNPLHRKWERYLGELRALEIYGLATRLDGFADNDYPPYDEGSSGLGAAKAAVQLGLITRYEHAFGFDHALEALMSGPCIVGANWYADMSRPAVRGFVNVTGPLLGGHEWALLGVSLEHQYVLGLNSWGRDWALRGYFKIPFPGFRRLLEEDGDVILPVRGVL